jgi:hypothetical protein
VSRAMAVALSTIAIGASGAIPASAASPEFGVAGFSVGATNATGEPYTQAGGHPYELSTTIELNTQPTHKGSFADVTPVEDPKDVAVDLPPGLVGDPEAVSKCGLALFGRGECPGSTQVGTALISRETVPSEPVYLADVYNVEPEAGHTAALGIRTPNNINYLLAAGVGSGVDAVPGADEEYHVRTVDEGVPLTGLTAITLTLWGVPAEKSHDPQRGNVCFLLEGPIGCKGGGESNTEPPVPFVTLPVRCTSGPLAAFVSMDSWEKPAAAPVHGEATLPAMTGCDSLLFDPSIRVAPETARADTPTGLTVELEVPQTESTTLPASAQVRDASVTLPAGMSLSPGAASGLEACGDAAFAKGSDEAAKCPDRSQIGEVTVETPLLPPHSITGELFVGEPLCGNAAHPTPCAAQEAQDGSLFRLFLQAQGSGVTVKLAGTMSVNQTTGRLTTSFDGAPQLPFEILKLQIDGGEQAPLANPQDCASLPAGPGGLPLAVTTSHLTPWSEPYTPDATPEFGFEVVGCAGAMGFAPSFSAGTVTPSAGAFSPFTMTLSRKDGEQNLGGVSLTMPPGVAGMLARVPLCPEPQAQEGKCPETSRIGTASAAAGAGSAPLWLSGGVFLTGPYKGAPFGLSIVVPAVAGPFNLGNVVERAAIKIDPKTAQVMVTAGPLQQSRDGVPFRLKALDVTIDRPGFIFNPTNCARMRVTGSVSGEMPDGSPGATAPVSSPFAVAGCGKLAFKPRFSVHTQAKTSRKNGASLHVVLQSSAGQANIGSVKVNLPKQLPSRQSTLKLACPESVFDADPAACPAGSLVGSAKARTPVLPVALTGPAIFVSHGGAKFPELVVVLQGDGVTVELAGETFINSKGVTSSTFRSVPDVPITRFDLTLPSGTHSALAGNGSFCKGALYMPTQIKGQNGAVVKQKTKIAVSGCPKAKKGKKVRRGH